MNKKIFEEESKANEFCDYLKNELPSIYGEFHDLEAKIKELEEIKKNMMKNGIKSTFDEKWINEQRYNKLKSILEDNEIELWTQKKN